MFFSPLASILAASNGITGGFNIPSKWLVKSSFDNISKISEIKQPLYIIAGENDDMLFPPIEHAIKLFNKVRDPKHLMIVPELGHVMFVNESYEYWKDPISVFLGK